MNDVDGHIGGIHFIWWIVGLIVLILIFLIPRDKSFQTSKEEPLQILNKRLANGEITKEEYLELKKILTADDKFSKNDDEPS